MCLEPAAAAQLRTKPADALAKQIAHLADHRVRHVAHVQIAVGIAAQRFQQLAGGAAAAALRRCWRCGRRIAAAVAVAVRAVVGAAVRIVKRVGELGEVRFVFLYYFSKFRSGELSRCRTQSLPGASRPGAPENMYIVAQI